jgi:hypothetical protein
MPIVPFDAEVARDNRLTIYVLPQDLDIAAVDPLLREVVTTINSSGWVWTSESCQGHPDAVCAEDTGWDHNTNPFLRLITREADLGSMLALLASAMRGETRVCTIRLHSVKKGEWIEAIVYVEAINALMRNQGIAALWRFAESLERRDTAAVAKVSPIMMERPLLVQRIRSLGEKMESDARFSHIVGTKVMAGIKDLLAQAAIGLEKGG